MDAYQSGSFTHPGSVGELLGSIDILGTVDGDELVLGVLDGRTDGILLDVGEMDGAEEGRMD